MDDPLRIVAIWLPTREEWEGFLAVDGVPTEPGVEGLRFQPYDEALSKARRSLEKAHHPDGCLRFLVVAPPVMAWEAAGRPAPGPRVGLSSEEVRSRVASALVPVAIHKLRQRTVLGVKLDHDAVGWAMTDGVAELMADERLARLGGQGPVVHVVKLTEEDFDAD